MRHVQTVSLLLLILASIAGGARFIGRTERFLIASFPRLKQVNYAVLPNPTWRPLVIGGLNRPEAVTIDLENKRLFVADGYDGTVFWYQLHVLPQGGRLMTDGRQHILMRAVIARGLAVDTLGALYVAGRVEPLPPAEPAEAIFKVDLHTIEASGAGVEPPPAPHQLWNRDNTVLMTGSSSPQLFEPSGLAVDPFHIFWSNLARGDATAGAIVKGTTEVPTYDAQRQLQPLADNVNEVTCLVLTPTHVYYAANGSVYGVPKGKETASCGNEGVLCPMVSYQESGRALRPTSMVWDGDGSIYLADSSTSSIYSFAAGTLSPHLLTKAADGRGVHGLAIYSEMLGGACRSHGCIALAVLVAWASAAALGLSRPGA